MGPRSKQEICDVLGHMIDELQQMRGALANLRSSIEQAAEHHEDDLSRLNRRVLELERPLPQPR